MRSWLLVRVAEVDLVDRDDAFSARVEVLQDRDEPRRFRVRMARTDLFHLQPTYPLDVWSAPSAPPAAESLWAGWPTAEAPLVEVEALSPDDALDVALARLAAAWPPGVAPAR